MAQGFTLKVCDLPQSHRDKVRKEDVKEGIAYRLAVKKTEGSAGKRQYNGANVMFCNRENGEQTDNCSEHLRTVLVQLPEDIVAIEYSAPWLCVYWQERGTIEDIDLIKGKLEELGSLL